jgi:hypothetical protein
MNGKKSVFVYIMLSCCIFLCCDRKKNDAPVPAGNTQSTVLEEYSYKVTSVKSNVAWSKDDAYWQTALVGLTLDKGTIVETGLASGATLSGTLGDMLMLGERAKVRLVVEELASKQPSSLAVRGVKLIKGIVQFAVAPHKGTFIVETPSARIKVKGTKFVVSFDEKNGLTDVRVQEGIVDVQDNKNRDTVYTLACGEALVNVGNVPVKRKMTNADSVVLKLVEPQAASPAQGNGEDVSHASGVSAPYAGNKETRKRLEEESQKNSGKETQAEFKRSSGASDSERAVSKHSADSVRSEYKASVKAEKDTFTARKATAVHTIDSTKRAAQSALDAEREKYKEATGNVKSSSGQSSDDAFDELQKRKAGR